MTHAPTSHRLHLIQSEDILNGECSLHKPVYCKLSILGGHRFIEFVQSYNYYSYMYNNPIYMCKVCSIILL